MTSKSYDDLKNRFKDVDQLLKAHTALTKFKKAESVATETGGTLAQLSVMVNALVTDPAGRGRPKEVDAINRAAFVLLIAHFQGFIEELHEEAGRLILNGRVNDVDAVIKLVKEARSNPHVDVINKMFAGIGIYEIVDRLYWQNCNNQSVKKRIRSALKTRNKIAHGGREKITKQRVYTLKQFIKILSWKLDEAVSKSGSQILGRPLW